MEVYQIKVIDKVSGEWEYRLTDTLLVHPRALEIHDYELICTWRLKYF